MNKKFKTTWAGMDEKIHAPKTTWSTGNLDSFDLKLEAKPVVHIIHYTGRAQDMNHGTRVHMWVLSGLLSWALKSYRYR